MRKTCVAFLFMALALVRPLVSQGQNEFPSTSGNAFSRVCSAIDKNADEETHLDIQHTVACIGYVSGIVEGVGEEIAYAHAVAGKEPPNPFCVPEDVENGQIIRIVLKYIANHPEQAHQRTAYLITVALKEAFPCSTRTDKKQ